MSMGIHPQSGIAAMKIIGFTLLTIFCLACFSVGAYLTYIEYKADKTIIEGCKK